MANLCVFDWKLMWDHIFFRVFCWYARIVVFKYVAIVPEKVGLGTLIF